MPLQRVQPQQALQAAQHPGIGSQVSPGEGLPGAQKQQEHQAKWRVRRANQPLVGLRGEGEGQAEQRGMRVKVEARRLLEEEAERRLAKAWKRREATARPGSLEAKAMGLKKRQDQLRERMAMEQAKIARLPEDEYRRQVREWDKERGERKAHGAAGGRAHNRPVPKLDLDELDGARRGLMRQWDWAAQRRRQRLALVAKQHDRLARQHAKRANSIEQQQVDAIKRSDMEAYYKLLRRQEHTTGDQANQRYKELEDFLNKTEEYLQKLSSKIRTVKLQQERHEAASEAAQAARARGETEEGVQAAADLAAKQSADGEDLYASHGGAEGYYSVAHAVREVVTRQPSMLQRGALREYQLVGLQWLVSLFNNRLNGILADEMGLGKTLQTLALLAYLWENKQIYGPHLIIVPNAVMLSWKEEIASWLPRMTTVFYKGDRQARHQLYQQYLATMRFNILVTTYELAIMDRAKLKKVRWKYVVIDEAQRLKDPSNKLNAVIMALKCDRRLLLTGTPLQNDLRELWSLLNLLLPQVFDSAKNFEDWFGSNNNSSKASGSAPDDSWLAQEQKKIVITRLHQILEPFMLRRVVSDVEGKLPPKRTFSIKCPCSGWQAVVYDWISRTGTQKNPPTDGAGKPSKSHYAPVSNRVMELRKVCNHPLLTHPPEKGGPDLSGDLVVRSCGKLWLLDRMLVKLYKAGHRVLLFSTMTRLLDVLEFYLKWRQVEGKHLEYRRIDGSTSFEAREQAISEFWAPDSRIFLFLLSIRAAGRGLNLQAADTVIIYDPDANPKNEEQAIARAHRIGQDKEVRVYHLECVMEDRDDDEHDDRVEPFGRTRLAPEQMGKTNRAYRESVETLLRENIQQGKIDMADEVIDAGKFDQQTSAQARQQQLERLLAERQQQGRQGSQEVPTLAEMNKLLARSDEELQLFHRLDREDPWPGPLLAGDDLPPWLASAISREEAESFLRSRPSDEPWRQGQSSLLPEQHQQFGRGARQRSMAHLPFPDEDDLDEEGGEHEREDEDDALPDDDSLEPARKRFRPSFE